MANWFEGMRSISSFAKVQTLVGNLIRNRTFQLRKSRPCSLEYLDIGCGRNSHAEFINLDYLWHPRVDVCWDITCGFPFRTHSMKGIFSEHCLEHFSLRVGFRILQECRRLLRPEGILRIVVPDAELYLSLYHRQNEGDTTASFPFQSSEAFDGVYSPLLSVKRVFYQDRDSLFGHRCMYDFSLLASLLRRIGFDSVQRTSFGQGRNPSLLIDSESRRSESLYVEAS